MKHPREFRILSPNKYQLYVSFFVALLGLMLSGYKTQTYQDCLVTSIALIVSLLCVINALLDTARMNYFERFIAFLWVVILLIFTPTTLWYIAHIKLLSYP